MTVTPGQILGKYRIDAEIGRGGMGIVYRGYDPVLRRPVAIKVLPPQLTVDPEFVQRFRQEAVVAAGLHHPGIVTIYDVGEESGLYFIVMEYLDGQTLDRLIASRGPLPLPEANRIVRQVAAALEYAHERGVVHRDIKPANIMVCRDGRVVLMDFGLVRAGEGTRLTRTGTLIGTPEYMAPEQAMGAVQDHRSDIYALGVVIYKMLSGKVPFSRSTPLAVSYAHVHDTPPPLRQARGDLPAAVEAVVGRALAKRPAERYQQVGLLAADFARAVGGDMPAPRKVTPVEARPPGRPAPSPAAQKSRLRWLPGVGVVVLLAAAAALVWALSRGPADRDRAVPLTPPPTLVTQDKPIAEHLQTSTLSAASPVPAATTLVAKSAVQAEITQRPTATPRPVSSPTRPAPTATSQPAASPTQPLPTAPPTRRPTPANCGPWHKQPKPGYGIVLIENHLGEELSVDYAVGGTGHWMLAAKKGEVPGRWWAEVPVGTHVLNYTSSRYYGRVTFHVEDGRSYTSPLWLNDRSEDYVYPMEIPAGCR